MVDHAKPAPLALSLRLGSWLEPALVGLAGLLLASVVAASDGGYFSDSWAWLAFVSLCVATLRADPRPGAAASRRLDWAFVARPRAPSPAWVALSTALVAGATPTIDETIRDASPTRAVVLALLLVVQTPHRRGAARRLRSPASR